MATPYDMRTFTAQGVQVLAVTDWFERSAVGEHWNAIKQFLATGDWRLLAPFEGTTIAGQRLQTDMSEIERWGLQGELDFEEIYPS